MLAHPISLRVAEGIRGRALPFLPILALVALAAATPEDEGMTLCPFALCTATACPGCGMTRALSALVKGHWADMVAYHPLAPLIGAQLLAGWGWLMWRRSGRGSPLSGAWITGTLIVTAAALVVVWVIRAISGALPPV